MRKLSWLRELAAVPPEHARFARFTPVVAEQLYNMARWNWSSVAPKAMRIALGFVCIIVGLQKLLTLFFVWFIAIVAHVPPAGAVGIFVATGFVRPPAARPSRVPALTLVHLRRGCSVSFPGWLLPSICMNTIRS